VVQASLETQIQQVKDNRERYASFIFDAKNRVKDNVSPVHKRLYYHYDAQLKKLQIELNRRLNIARRVQMEAKLADMKLVPGNVYHYPRTNTTGVLDFDAYGYCLLRPSNQPPTGTIALYEHSLRELQPA
jgi:hypothetical protein